MNFCTIRRVYTAKLEAVRLAEVQDCGNPLRTPHQQATGVCEVCYRGFESVMNRFANDDEYYKAVSAKESS